MPQQPQSARKEEKESGRLPQHREEEKGEERGAAAVRGAVEATERTLVHHHTHPHDGWCVAAVKSRSEGEVVREREKRRKETQDWVSSE